MEQGSGYSAAWFSAFVWGTKGREFESRWNRHFLSFKDNLKLNLSEQSKEIINALWQLKK